MRSSRVSLGYLVPIRRSPEIRPGQSQTINLVMESVQGKLPSPRRFLGEVLTLFKLSKGLFSAYPRIDRLRIWEQFFQGLIELVSSQRGT